jgi:dihydroneopterin aldolase
MGAILVEGLEALGVHGILPEEQASAQPFGIDIELDVDLAPAGESDELADTIDYGAVIDAARRVVETERHRLLERLARRIADVCLEDARVTGATVTVRKLRPPVAARVAAVGVRISV